MICNTCGSSDIEDFSTENIECCTCGGNVPIVHTTCRECGSVWKSINGKVMDSVTCNNLDLPAGLFDFMTSIDISAFTVELVASKGINDTKDLMHECLRCGFVAYEVTPNSFQCSECGFEWEVVSI